MAPFGSFCHERVFLGASTAAIFQHYSKTNHPWLIVVDCLPLVPMSWHFVVMKGHTWIWLILGTKFSVTTTVVPMVLSQIQDQLFQHSSCPHSPLSKVVNNLQDPLKDIGDCKAILWDYSNTSEGCSAKLNVPFVPLRGLGAMETNYYAFCNLFRTKLLLGRSGVVDSTRTCNNWGKGSFCSQIAARLVAKRTAPYHPRPPPIPPVCSPNRSILPSLWYPSSKCISKRAKFGANFLACCIYSRSVVLPSIFCRVHPISSTTTVTAPLQTTSGTLECKHVNRCGKEPN